jgi:hypothetical protein
VRLVLILRSVLVIDIRRGGPPISGSSPETAGPDWLKGGYTTATYIDASYIRLTNVHGEQLFLHDTAIPSASQAILKSSAL